MLVQYEKRNYSGKEKIWVGAYANLHNLSHWHIDNEIIYAHIGSAIVSINGELYSLEQGESIFCQSGSLHYIKGSENSLLYIFLFDNKPTEEITSAFCLKSPLLQHHYDLDKYFELIKDELKKQSMFYELRTNSLIMYLVSDIFRHEEVVQSVVKNKTILNYKDLLNRIDEAFEYITFSDAANFMGLSDTYFSKLFKNICGMTFSQYLNIVRIEKAIGFLNSEERIPISEIAVKCGYYSIRHFNRMFLQETGYSPKQLPAQFRLDVKPIKTVKDAFDPTLEESRLVY
ncbi:MAG: AraC family transcriptional regulator [Candidatus Izemoplasmatales bacterium]|nr:AraC family transcriptional regulator [Candidatus Izemoplasmatales bacterium]